MNVQPLGMLLLFAVSASPGAPAQEAQFPSEASRVTVDVVVTDGDGQPIAGLAREDFVVKENGVVQEVLEFEAVHVSSSDAGAETAAVEAHLGVATNAVPPAPGRSFLLVLDDLNLAPASANAVKRALTQFLAEHLREGDTVTLAPTAGGAWWTGRMTEGREDLVAALQSLRGRRIPDLRPERMSDHEAMLIENRRDREAARHVQQRFGLRGVVGAEQAEALVRVGAANQYAQAVARNRRALRSLERAMNAAAGGRGRRVVILASDGFIQDDDLAELRQVREAARHANAALYFLDARGLRVPDILDADTGGSDPVTMPTFMALEMEYQAMTSAGAEALADDTGGFSIRGTNRLATGLARISDESRTYYLLGYEPADKRADGRFRKIQVEVRRPKVKVRARAGYYAEGGAPKKKGEEAPAAAEPPAAALRALDAPSEERGISVRMAAYILGGAEGGRATVLLTAEADPAGVDLQQGGGVLKGALETFSSLAARDTGEIARRERLVDLDLEGKAHAQMARTWIPVTHAYELPPGRYQATLAVRDRRSGRVGSVRHDFEVPSLATLRVTTPILTDVLQRGAEGAAPIPVPIARRSFPPGTRLLCAFSVEVPRTDGGNGAARIAIAYEVRRSDGTVVTRASPAPLAPAAGGEVPGRFTLTLNRPGTYEVHVRARDEASGEEASAVQAFVVD